MSKLIKFSLYFLFVAFVLTSCDKNDDDNNTITVFLNQTQLSYDDNGVWNEAMTEGSKIISQDLVFSHEAMPDYNFWSGFIASRNNDTNDYSEPFSWLEHQNTAITGGGLSGTGTPYFVSYWNSSESNNIELNSASCTITYKAITDVNTFIPQSVYVTNTTYTYYTMINGSAYSKAFTTGDYFRLLIYGITANGTKTGPVTFDLANYTNENSKPVNTWEYVNLEELGEVVGIYFQMDSSDKGKWGINTPTFFAIDRLTIKAL